MIKFRRSVATGILTAVVSLAGVLLPGQAQAVEPFSSPVTILDPSCSFDQAHVQTAADATGKVHGFADLWAVTAIRTWTSATSSERRRPTVLGSANPLACTDSRSPQPSTRPGPG